MSASRIYRVHHGPTEWTTEVVARRVYALLATLNLDGSPHTVPVMYAFDGDRFLFESRSTTRKVRNIEMHSQVRVLVQGPPEREGWVAADGTATILDGPEAQRLNHLVASRYLTEAGNDGWSKTIAPLDDITIVLTPGRWSWWDGSAMFEAIFDRGYDEAAVESWFEPLDP